MFHHIVTSMRNQFEISHRLRIKCTKSRGKKAKKCIHCYLSADWSTKIRTCYPYIYWPTPNLLGHYLTRWIANCNMVYIKYISSRKVYNSKLHVPPHSVVHATITNNDCRIVPIYCIFMYILLLCTYGRWHIY